MKKQNKTLLFTGLGLLLAFVVWTILIKTVDVQPVGPNGSEVGFATINAWFHNLTGVNWTLYNITDWLGFVPIGLCVVFAVLGLVQLIKRKSLYKVDKDIICLGVYYIVVILAYFIFEMIPLNYRPVIIENRLEASYPSSTTLLVLSVMPTLVFEANRRINDKNWKCAIDLCSIFFATFMVVGRAISGVHWLTDILGSVILSAGLYLLFRAVVSIIDAKCEKAEKSDETEKGE